MSSQFKLSEKLYFLLELGINPKRVSLKADIFVWWRFSRTWVAVPARTVVVFISRAEREEIRLSKRKADEAMADIKRGKVKVYTLEAIKDTFDLP